MQTILVFRSFGVAMAIDFGAVYRNVCPSKKG